MQELLELSHEEQDRLLKRLTHHALCKMQHLTWRGARLSRGGSVPGGYEPADFALDAIQKALDGTRPWNRQKYPTLESFLRSVIDSDISHLVESVDNSAGRRMLPVPTNGGSVTAYDVLDIERNPLKLLIEKDSQKLFREAAMKELSNEPFLGKLLECLEVITAIAQTFARVHEYVKGASAVEQASQLVQDQKLKNRLAIVVEALKANQKV